MQPGGIVSGGGWHFHLCELNIPASLIPPLRALPILTSEPRTLTHVSLPWTCLEGKGPRGRCFTSRGKKSCGCLGRRFASKLFKLCEVLMLVVSRQLGPGAH